jgi:hypothetical protein
METTSREMGGDDASELAATAARTPPSRSSPDAAAGSDGRCGAMMMSAKADSAQW